jgi:metallo-beta-lactamase class B
VKFSIFCLSFAVLWGQAPSDTVESHVAAARAAGAKQFPGLFDRICSADALRPPAPANPAAANAARPGPPARETWHAEPVKVFDNLYFFGEKEYSVWAVTTSQGIIVIDTIFDYSVEDEVVGGMKKLGLDPANIKYAIVSHGHYDHSGGARFLQERFGTKVYMSPADWDLLDRNTRDPSKPKRDLVATDGMKLTLGDTTLTLYITPGHTPGTISTLVPVKDKGTPHLAAAWGGTAFNFARSPEAFRIYINSAERFRSIVEQAGADVIIANHTNFDGSKVKLPAIDKRRPGDPHPYVVGKSGVLAYLTTADECAKAALLSLNAR